MARGGFSATVGLFVMAGALGGCLGGPATVLDDPDPLAGLPVWPGEYNFAKNFSQVLSPGPLPLAKVSSALITSTLDGADIPMSLWRPDVASDVKTPIIVWASPYWPADLVSAASESRMIRLKDNFVAHGYTVVALPVRGTSNHGGCMDLMGPKERHDLDQAITWLATQDWSNGKVALIGGSYDGSTPWELTAVGNDHVATIVPISGVPDIYELMFRNGTAETRGPLLLNALYYEYFATEGRDPAKIVQGAVCPESWTGFGASLYSGATGAEDPAGWWAERNSKPGTEKNWRGSVLLVQGLQDWNVDPALNIPWVQSLADHGITVHQWLGQWSHQAPDSNCRNDRAFHNNCRWDWAEYLLYWFDYWLKGDTSIDLGPAVQVQRSDGAWRTEAEWPPTDANWTTLELSASPNRLVANGEGKEGTSLLLPNPTAATSVGGLVGAPGAYVDYSTGPLPEGIHISGLPQVHIKVEPQGPGGTLAAWLYKRGSDGVLHRLGWTAINLAFADGTRDMHPVVPSQPLVARMEIQPMDAKVGAGAELVLRLWQYPPEDRFANTPPSQIEVFAGGGVSLVRLPLIERDGSTTFEPPYPPRE